MQDALALVTLLKATRASLAAASLQLDAAIGAVEQALTPEPPPAVDPPRESCTHLNRRPLPAMGDPGRTQCANTNCLAILPGQKEG